MGQTTRTLIVLCCILANIAVGTAIISILNPADAQASPKDP